MDTDLKKPQRTAGNKTPVAQTSTTLPVYDSLTLLTGKNEAVITHGGEEYHLKLTRQGKLILTK